MSATNSQTAKACPRTERVIAAAAKDSVTSADVMKRLVVGLEALCRQLEAENLDLHREVRDATRGGATEAMWKERQGEEYGSY